MKVISECLKASGRTEVDAKVRWTEPETMNSLVKLLESGLMSAFPFSQLFLSSSNPNTTNLSLNI